MKLAPKLKDPACKPHYRLLGVVMDELPYFSHSKSVTRIRKPDLRLRKVSIWFWDVFPIKRKKLLLRIELFEMDSSDRNSLHFFTLWTVVEQNSFILTQKSSIPQNWTQNTYHSISACYTWFTQSPKIFHLRLCIQSQFHHECQSNKHKSHTWLQTSVASFFQKGISRIQNQRANAQSKE